MLVQQERKGGESQNPDNFASVFPAIPSPPHQEFSSPPRRSLTVPYSFPDFRQPQLQTGMSSEQAAPAQSRSHAWCVPGACWAHGWPAGPVRPAVAGGGSGPHGYYSCYSSSDPGKYMVQESMDQGDDAQNSHSKG